MKFIDKLERKFGRFGIQNLTIYIIGCYVLGYILTAAAPGVLSMLSLDMSMVMKGQIWRLVTWVIYPPSSVGGMSNLLMFVLAIAFFYYPIGTSLERTWGTFRYTLYIFSGLLFTVIAAVLLHVFTGGYVVMNGIAYSLGGNIFTTYYISLSIFLAYAVTYPDLQLLLMFVIPIKMKWMAFVYGLFIAWDIVSYLRVGLWVGVVPIVASLLNFVIFYFSTRDMNRYNPKEIHRRQQFKKAMAPTRTGYGPGGIAKHKCAICGRTEKDDPNLEFRFCSKCKGNYEYCQDHVFTHKHVQ